MEIFSSDSDSLEDLMQLSDWDTEESNDDDFESEEHSDSEGKILFKSHKREDEVETNEDSNDAAKSDGEVTDVARSHVNLDTQSSDADESSQHKIRRVNYMQTLEDAEFTFRFRLNKTAVQSLLIEIIPFVRVTSSRNNGVSPLHQLLMTLRFYALGKLNSTGVIMNVAKSTASRIVTDISSAIAKLYEKYIYMHQDAAENFYRIASFPRALAAIDCTHVHIQQPSLCLGEEYRNRRGYWSLNVQAACDADLKFMNVEAQPGSKLDATLFENSVLKAQCDSGQFSNRWLLGDSAYPNRPYLLTPIQNPVTAAEQKYNEAHIKTRNTINQAFGLWKRRFPVVTQKLFLSLSNIQALTIATAVLHNICINYNLEEVSAEVEPLLAEDIDVVPQSIDGQYDYKDWADLVNNYFSMI